MLWAAGCSGLPNDKQETSLTIQTPRGPVGIKVEIADSEPLRRQGLMHRTRMEKNTGMLFVFDHPDRVMFWMKDTPLPLDILFLSADQKVLYIEEQTVPLSTAIITSPREVKYAIEVNAGFCQKNGVRIGDSVLFPEESL